MLAKPGEANVKLDKLRIGLVFILVTLIFSILALIYWDFVRDTIIVPIYFLIWVTSRILKSFPQTAYLALLILISILVGFNTLRGIKNKPLTSHPEAKNAEVESRYLRWRQLCARLYASPFSREQFAWEARRVILSILAYQRGIDLSEAEAMVKNGVLDVPEPIRNLVQQRDLQVSRRTPHGLKGTILRLRLSFRQTESQADPLIDSQVAEFIKFIERYLEIKRV